MNKMIMTTITVALCATILRGNDAERLAELERICAFVPCDDLTFPEVVPTPADIISKYHVTTNQVAIDLKTIATKYTSAESDERKRDARSQAISYLATYGSTNDLAFLSTIITSRNDFAQSDAIGASIGILKHSPELIDFVRGIVTNADFYNVHMRGTICVRLRKMCRNGHGMYINDPVQEARIAAFFIEQAGINTDLVITIDRRACELNPWYRHSQQRQDNLARLRPPGLTGRPKEIYDAAQRDAAQED